MTLLNKNTYLLKLLLGWLVLLLSGCGSSTSDIYTLSGTVSGLSGKGLVVHSSNGDSRTISANGPFSFATQLSDGASYAVTIATQPSGPSQICKVTNGSGTITGADVSNVIVSCELAYTLSGTVSGLSGTGLVLQSSNGDSQTISANGPFSFATRLSDGASYAVSIATQPSAPSQICKVTNGSGTISTADFSNVTVSCAQFVYVANSKSNTISTYIIDAATGVLNPVGEPVPTDIYPTSIAVDPTGRFAYVANNVSRTISSYLIDPTTGTLTLISSTTPQGSDEPRTITIAPNGRFAYVLSNVFFSYISTYAINTATGTLTAVGNSKPAGPLMLSITTEPSGRFMYASGLAGTAIFTIDGVTGLPDSVGNISTGGGFLAVEPTGKFAYVTLPGVALPSIVAYAINATTGLLTQVGSLIEVSASAIAVEPKGRFAYAADYTSNLIYGYAIDASTGALASHGNPTATGTYPSAIAVDLTGKFVYVVNRDSNDISAYRIGATGVLASVDGGLAVKAGTEPISIATTR